MRTEQRIHRKPLRAPEEGNRAAVKHGAWSESVVQEHIAVAAENFSPN
jgi:hypothetical protein